MIVLSGAEVVLPDRVLSPGTIVIDGGRIVEIKPSGGSGAGTANFAFHGHYIVPGFIDVHVHGVDGIDTLNGSTPVADMAAKLPRFGVTGFCPTTVACAPLELRSVLEQVRRARETPDAHGARVLPAHLESNFISPDYRGAQPVACLRSPRTAIAEAGGGGPASALTFSGGEILREIEERAPDVGIVTVAPELDGGLELINWLTSRNLRVSLGHSGATYDEAQAAVAAGAKHATHVFNRMPPLDHRKPGLVGAVLQSDEIAAELICDGVHVHPALIRTAVAAKHPARVMAITDGTAGAGLPVGSPARLGSQSIRVGESGAILADGTLAGSVVTMDRAFEFLVSRAGFSLVEAALMCATTPARELGLVGYGVIKEDSVADLVVLDQNFAVVQTYIGGRLVFSRTGIS